MKQPPKEIYAAYEGDDGEDQYISAGVEPDETAIGLGEKKIVGRYVLVETMEVDYRVNITARQTIEQA